MILVWKDTQFKLEYSFLEYPCESKYFAIIYYVAVCIQWFLYCKEWDKEMNPSALYKAFDTDNSFN